MHTGCLAPVHEVQLCCYTAGSLSKSMRVWQLLWQDGAEKCTQRYFHLGQYATRDKCQTTPCAINFWETSEDITIACTRLKVKGKVCLKKKKLTRDWLKKWQLLQNGPLARASAYKRKEDASLVGQKTAKIRRGAHLHLPVMEQLLRQMIDQAAAEDGDAWMR